MPKTCFVTIGATAAFDNLLQNVLTPAFCESLSTRGYTDLLLQYGKDGSELYKQYCAQIRDFAANVNISGFDLDKAGLNRYMRLAKGKTLADEGVVISHAGSGTILDALRIAVPLIVIPNTTLLDNHQVELAEALAEQGYVIHGRLDQLERALDDAEALRKQHREWPPVNSGSEGRGLKNVLDDEMGFLD